MADQPGSGHVSGQPPPIEQVFDHTIDLDQTPDGYRAMDRREALKTLIRP